jgi:hypothetical protein
MCHVSSESDGHEEADTPEDITLKPIMWGAANQPSDDSDEIGHCSFAAKIVDAPIIGRSYR